MMARPSTILAVHALDITFHGSGRQCHANVRLRTFKGDTSGTRATRSVHIPCPNTDPIATLLRQLKSTCAGGAVVGGMPGRCGRRALRLWRALHRADVTAPAHCAFTPLSFRSGGLLPLTHQAWICHGTWPFHITPLRWWCCGTIWRFRTLRPRIPNFSSTDSGLNPIYGTQAHAGICPNLCVIGRVITKLQSRIIILQMTPNIYHNKSQDVFNGFMLYFMLYEPFSIHIRNC